MTSASTLGIGRRTGRRGIVAACAVFALLGGCSSNSSSGPSSSGSSSTGSASSAALNCTPMPGEIASPSCNDVPSVCPAKASACTASPCNTASACLALADNSGKSVANLRMRKLHIAAPPTLALAFVQGTLVDQNVDLKNTCCEGGDGGFNVLVQLDTVGKTFTLGGGPVTSDPVNVGYCFVNQTSEGLTIAPVSASASQAADKTWQSGIFSQKFNMPIFAHGDPNNLIILPVTATRLQNVSLSADGNCIGSYDETAACQPWVTAATLSGFITLEDADRVLIPDLGGASLCTLLTSQASGTTCTRDANGKISAPGDYCSTTNAPATASTCADSSWLSATFAASAAIIGSGAGVAQCEGVGDAAPE